MKVCFKIESAEIRKVGDSKIYSVTLRGIDEERREAVARAAYICAVGSEPSTILLKLLTTDGGLYTMPI
jgi:hypothetical protein